MLCLIKSASNTSHLYPGMPRLRMQIPWNAGPCRVIGTKNSSFYPLFSSSYPLVLINSPICFEELAESSLEETVYCQAMCGNNIHKECFNQWARSKRREGVQVTCGSPLLIILEGSYSLVYCRCAWEDGPTNNKRKDIDDGEGSGDERYVNLGKLVGLSSVRGITYVPVCLSSLTWGRE